MAPKTSTPQTPPTAAQAYAQRRKNIDALMGQIRAQLEREDQNENINWAHVGSMGHVEELLRQINEFMS